ncbi:MAG: HAD family hydrolase [Clostridia bacterium]|nr:HAD family hydrolase [Clostridia bacterium]
MNKVVFLDRDGTINEDYGYVFEIEKFKFIKGVIEGLKILRDLGYKLIVITNQSGIARGYYTKEDAIKIFEYMKNELLKENIIIEKVYYCPHIGDNCNCRKPKLELFYKAQKEFDIDFKESYAIGDKVRDLAICEKENVKGFLLNNKEKIENENIKRSKNLLEAAKYIQKNQKI